MAQSVVDRHREMLRIAQSLRVPERVFQARRGACDADGRFVRRTDEDFCRRGV